MFVNLEGELPLDAIDIMDVEVTGRLTGNSVLLPFEAIVAYDVDGVTRTFTDAVAFVQLDVKF